MLGLKHSAVAKLKKELVEEGLVEPSTGYAEANARRKQKALDLILEGKSDDEVRAITGYPEAVIKGFRRQAAEQLVKNTPVDEIQVEAPSGDELCREILNSIPGYRKLPPASATREDEELNLRREKAARLYRKMYPDAPQSEIDEIVAEVVPEEPRGEPREEPHRPTFGASALASEGVDPNPKPVPTVRRNNPFCQIVVAALLNLSEKEHTPPAPFVATLNRYELTAVYPRRVAMALEYLNELKELLDKANAEI